MNVNPNRSLHPDGAPDGIDAFVADWAIKNVPDPTSAPTAIRAEAEWVRVMALTYLDRFGHRRQDLPDHPDPRVAAEVDRLESEARAAERRRGRLAAARARLMQLVAAGEALGKHPLPDARGGRAGRRVTVRYFSGGRTLVPVRLAYPASRVAVPHRSPARAHRFGLAATVGVVISAAILVLAAFA